VSTSETRARVYLAPDDRSGFQVPKTAETAPDGSFTITSVPPGSYSLYVAPPPTRFRLHRVETPSDSVLSQSKPPPSTASFKEVANAILVHCPPIPRRRSGGSIGGVQVA